MDAKQRGFTLIEILVVVTIIGVLAGLVVVLIPKSQAEASKLKCISNIRNVVGLIEGVHATKYPAFGGPNLVLYLVKKGEIVGEKNLQILFCPGDGVDSWEDSGGLEAYKGLDLKKKGEYGQLTSYAGRSRNSDCVAKKGSMKSVILVCDDSDDHHDHKGFVCGYTGGAAEWRDKFDNWGLDHDTPVEIGENSSIDELKCLLAD